MAKTGPGGMLDFDALRSANKRTEPFNYFIAEGAVTEAEAEEAKKAAFAEGEASQVARAAQTACSRSSGGASSISRGTIGSAPKSTIETACARRTSPSRARPREGAGAGRGHGAQGDRHRQAPLAASREAELSRHLRGWRRDSGAHDSACLRCHLGSHRRHALAARRCPGHRPGSHRR